MDNGISSSDEHDVKLKLVQDALDRSHHVIEHLPSLIDKSQALVDLLDDTEVNHGGLIGTKTLRAKNELRLELSKWK